MVVEKMREGHQQLLKDTTVPAQKCYCVRSELPVIVFKLVVECSIDFSFWLLLVHNKHRNSATSLFLLRQFKRETKISPFSNIKMSGSPDLKSEIVASDSIISEQNVSDLC